MKKSAKPVFVVIVALVVALMIGARTLQGARLGDKFEKVLKGVAIAALTDALSEQLNDFINSVTLNKGIPPQAATKVVPIVAFGSGTRVGAGQVTGPKELVDTVQVLVQIETKFSQKNLDVEVVVPSDNLNPLKFNRVEGVGVSALIDLRLSGI